MPSCAHRGGTSKDMMFMHIHPVVALDTQQGVFKGYAPKWMNEANLDEDERMEGEAWQRQRA